MLDVKDDFTTRRRRVPGGILPSVPRWTEQGNDGGDRIGMNVVTVAVTVALSWGFLVYIEYVYSQFFD